MAIKDVFKVSRKTFFNPRSWLGYDQLKSNTQLVWSVIKDLITPAKADITETFEEAMHRLNVTEADLNNKAQVFFSYAILFVLFAAISLLFGCYYLFHHKALLGCLLSLAVTALFLSQAFRYHFWYFQIKHRKLGCSFEEWRRGKPYDEKESAP